jgi:hypothetical protein
VLVLVVRTTSVEIENILLIYVLFIDGIDLFSRHAELAHRVIQSVQRCVLIRCGGELLISALIVWFRVVWLQP